MAEITLADIGQREDALVGDVDRAVLGCEAGALNGYERAVAQDVVLDLLALEVFPHAIHAVFGRVLLIVDDEFERVVEVRLVDGGGPAEIGADAGEDDGRAGEEAADQVAGRETEQVLGVVRLVVGAGHVVGQRLAGTQRRHGARTGVGVEAHAQDRLGGVGDERVIGDTGVALRLAVQAGVDVGVLVRTGNRRYARRRARRARAQTIEAVGGGTRKVHGRLAIGLLAEFDDTRRARNQAGGDVAAGGRAEEHAIRLVAGAGGGARELHLHHQIGSGAVGLVVVDLDLVVEQRCGGRQ